MKRGKLFCLILFLLLSNFYYSQGTKFLNLNNNDLTEEEHHFTHKIPKLASNATIQDSMKALEQITNEELSDNIAETLKGFNGGFLENNGQKNSEIFYYTENPQMGVGFGTSEIRFSIINQNKDSSEITDETLPGREGTNELTYTTIVLELLNSNKINPIAEYPTGTFNNYIIGGEEGQWVGSSQIYTKLVYHNIYEKIDLVYILKDGQLKYEFFVNPGGNINDIKLNWIGPVSLELANEGIRVTVKSDGHYDFSFVDTSPINYQSEKREKQIDGSFKILGSSTYGFSIPKYDVSKLLIIDPTLSYSTYLSGSMDDSGYDITIDDSGNVYVTGESFSTDFPIVNAYDNTGDGSTGTRDVFVFKLNSTGSGLLYSTYIGGSSSDFGNAIAIDNSGNAYVTGWTQSTNFPTVNAYDNGGDGSTSTYDTFVFKLNSTGNGLLYSTYLAGSGSEVGYGIAIDSTGNAYVTGWTGSTDFPTVNAYAGDGGTRDVFVFKLNSTGNGLLYSTYVGGEEEDYGEGITIDGIGNAYVTGYTYSTDFPTVNAYDNVGDGSISFQDVFVFKLNSTGNGLLYSTYVGGSSYDKAYGIALDSTGNVFVSGETRSPNFPAVNAYASYYGGVNSDIFVFKLNNTGNGLFYSTCVGGNNNEQGYGIVIDGSGNAYVTGSTTSTDFPTVNAYDDTGEGIGNDGDAYVLKLNNTGNGLLYSTYVSGSEYDRCAGIAIDDIENIFVTGETRSTDFPTLNAYDDTGDGSATYYDAFAFKLIIPKPIYIDDNSDFVTIGFPGDGTQDNPFIIDGFQITDATTTLIHIQDTTSYFVIHDNLLDGLNGNFDGIYLENVTNGIITNNTIKNNRYGIYLYSSTDNSTITNNTIHNNTESGIFLFTCANNIISNNDIFNNVWHGISLFSSFNNITVLNNKIHHNSQNGIQLLSSSYKSNICNNLIYNNVKSGINVYSSSNNSIFDNLIYNNTENGIWLYNSAKNNTITNNSLYFNSWNGIYLYTAANDNTISNNTANNNLWSGIRLHSSDNNNFTNNLLFNNTFWGIRLFNSSLNLIINNTIFYNFVDGVLLQSSFDNTFTENIINSNDQYGINLDSSSGFNSIYQNDFEGNPSGQATDNNGTSFFYQNGIGNYWGDYSGVDTNCDTIGDTPYDISGTPGNMDPFPLMFLSELYTTFEGNWLVNNTSIRQNEIITLNGNLTISSTGDLLLHNVILRFNCSYNGQYHIEVESGGNLTIDAKSVVTTINISHAWYFKANNGSSILLQNSTFNYAGYDYGDKSGLYFNTNGVQIINCSIYNNYDGLFLEAVANAFIDNNNIYNNTENGIKVESSDNNIIENNAIYNNSEYGIWLTSSSNNTLLNNTIYDNSESGMFLSTSSNVNRIFNNSIYNNSWSGISLVNTNNNTLTNNTINNHSGYGIILSSSTNTTIYNNTISNQIYHGIHLFYSDHNTLLSNIVYNNFWYGIALEFSANNTLSKNTIFNTSQIGIFLGSSDNNSISRNSIYNSSQIGILLTSSINNDVTINTIYDNTFHGITLESSSNKTKVTWNIFIDNNQGSTQAYDAGFDNNFEYNFWNELTGPDNNNDGIVDIPYVITGSASNNDLFPRSYPSIPHDPINIDGNAGFIVLGFPGQGTIGDPYLIEEYFIANFTTYLIHIQNTEAYFIIQNNFLNGLNGSYDGIVLTNVTNGIITNNVLWYGECGLILDSSFNNTISGNTIFNNSLDGIRLNTASNYNNLTGNVIFNNSLHGIAIASSTNCILSNNIIFNNSQNGILLLAASDENTITSNIISSNQYDGIVVASSSNNISNNTITNNRLGIWVSSSSATYNTIFRNTITNNSMDGIYIYSLGAYNVITGNFIFNNTQHGIYVASSSTNNILKDNIISNNTGFGIYIATSTNNILVNNTIFNNANAGFMLRSSVNNTLTNNTIYNNLYGFRIDLTSTDNTITGNIINNNQGDGIYLYITCDNNTLLNNTIFDNSRFGIYITSSSKNTVTFNNIFNNSDYGIAFDSTANDTIVEWNFIINNNPSGTSQASDNGQNNTFSYNYWDDWINPDANSDGYVDIVYDIDGIAGNNDSFPLSNPYIHHEPIFIDENADFVTYGFPGGGTQIDPYRIENYLITNSSTFLISIQNTTVYFRIQNNLLNGVDSSYSSIRLINITHAIIVNNIIFNCGNGIALDNSSNNNISGNTIYNSFSDGIWLSESSFNSLFNNNIYNSSSSGIEMWLSPNNTIYLNNIFNHTDAGIMLNNSPNSTIFSNIVYSNNYGIGLDYSSDNSLYNNTIYNNTGNLVLQASSNNAISNNSIFYSNYGITLYFDSNNNALLNNIIYSNSIFSIYGYNSTNILVANNTIFNSLDHGIWFDSTSFNRIEYNTIYNGSTNGIYMTYSNNTNVTGNIVYNNSRYGIFLNTSSNNNLISGNEIYNNSLIDPSGGIGLFASHDNTILNNSIKDHTNYGVIIDITAVDNLIKWNDFIDNNSTGTSQVLDNGTSNIFEYNYWNNWITPDTSPTDGIVDVAYAIDGLANNYDYYPLAISVIHDLTIPTVVNPNGGSFQGNIAIQWIASVDSLNHTVNYTLYFSSDSGSTWTELVSGLTNTSYLWVITSVTNGDSYMIRVNATCSEGLWQIDESDSTFTIDNPILDSDHPVIISFPTDFSFYEHTTGHSINWTATDLNPYFYSIWRNGTLVIQEDAWSNNIPIIFNEFDGLAPGMYNYTIEITDINDNSAVDGVWVTVIENIAPVVTVIYPDGGEIFSGEIFIAWNALDDFSKTPLTYFVYYWNGNTWINLASNISETTYRWNTRTVVDRSDYLIQVNASDGYLNGTDTSDNTFIIDNIPFFEQISPGHTEFQSSDFLGVSVLISVTDVVNITIELHTETDILPPSDADPLGIYLNVTISDDAIFEGLWFNVSFSELGDQNPVNVRIYYYHEDDEAWNEVKNTGVNYDNEIVYGWANHLTLFGVMDVQVQASGNLAEILLLTVIIITPIALVSIYIYRRTRRQMRLKKVKKKVRKTQLDLGLIEDIKLD